MVDPSEAGRQTARRLRAMLDDVKFPVSRDELVSHLGERELEIAEGNRIRPADFLQSAPDEEFHTPIDVAQRLILMGAIRARGTDRSENQETKLPGRQGLGTSYESAHHREPATDEESHPTAPPSGETDLKGVRRPST